MNDLTRSLRENNQDYPPGNVSHIPGMDFNDYEKKAMQVVGRRVSKSSGMGTCYDVYLKGRLIDIVYFDEPPSPEMVKKILVNEEKYDPAIMVVRSKAVSGRWQQVPVNYIRTTPTKSQILYGR